MNILEKASAMFELIMVANLIMAMIEGKASASAVDELCREKDKDYGSVDRSTQPMTTDGVASVIASAFESTATIVTSEEGDIAVLLTPTDNPTGGPRLSFFKCSMNEFIKNAHMDPIIDNAVQIAEEVLRGNGKSPRSIKLDRVNIKDLNVDPTQQLLPFEQTEESISSEISKLIEEVLTFNTGNSDIGFRRALSEKLTSDTLPEEYNNDRTSSPTETNLSPEAESRILERDKMFSRSILPGNISNKPIQLTCGTIENLREALDLLKE
jgi:hypothetical protein